MVAQRGAGVGARTVAPARHPAPAVAAPAPVAPPSQRKKLSFKDKHALEVLPADMARLRADIARLTAILADPDLYARDPGAFTEAGLALDKARADLGAAEDRWLELEMLREELEA
jgi:ATP-binding cassette subfamily F protein uup